mmetsp:Transcript_63223/g.150792  ORF Transcript_63223/g.150792 Transcript_63223/m.150792 type:complete len:166 (-) Transcript_63223:193-690(-)
MARVGISNYYFSADNPVRAGKYWENCIEREQRDHRFSSLNKPFPKPSYAGLGTTSSDDFSRTWHPPCNVRMTTVASAGKAVFHLTAGKPLQGGATAPIATLANPLDRLPPARRDEAKALSRSFQPSRSVPTLLPYELANALNDDAVSNAGTERRSIRSSSSSRRR